MRTDTPFPVSALASFEPYLVQPTHVPHTPDRHNLPTEESIKYSLPFINDSFRESDHRDAYYPLSTRRMDATPAAPHRSLANQKGGDKDQVIYPMTLARLLKQGQINFFSRH